MRSDYPYSERIFSWLHLIENKNTTQWAFFEEEIGNNQYVAFLAPQGKQWEKESITDFTDFVTFKSGFNSSNWYREEIKEWELRRKVCKYPSLNSVPMQ